MDGPWADIEPTFGKKLEGKNFLIGNVNFIVGRASRPGQSSPTLMNPQFT